MSFLMDDLASGGQIIVGSGTPKALGVGDGKIRGSVFIEGPLQVGTAGAFGNVRATVMIGKLQNSDATKPQYSLWSFMGWRFR